MKVLLLHRNSFDKIGGVETTIKAMAETLHGLGHEVYVCAHATKDSAEEEKTEIATIIRIKNCTPPKILSAFSPTADYFGNQRALKACLKRIQPDFVIVRDNVYALLVSNLYDPQKIVYVPLGVIRDYKKSPREAGFSGNRSLKVIIIEIIRRLQMHQFDFYQRMGLKRTNVVVFSEAMRQQILRLFPTKKNLYQYYPGVDERYYTEMAATEVHTKQLLFVGRLAQVKNLRMLFRAFAKMQNQQAELVVVGDGEERACLVELAETMGLSDRIHFVGASRECEKYYRSAAYSLLTSVYEAYGNVLAESLISGTPVIAFSSDLPEVKTATNELVSDEENGFLCRVFSEEELAKTMERALEFAETEAYFEMRKRCETAAREKFSWQKFLEFCLECTQKEKK